MKTNKQIKTSKKEVDQPENITFYGSRFASIAFPARTPKGRLWERINGRDSLIISAGEKKNPKTGKTEDLKVPSGIIPRRILIYLSHVWMLQRQAGVREKRIKLGSCLHDFLTHLELKAGGKQYKQIIEQTNRLFLAKIAFHSRSEYRYSIEQALVAKRYELWWGEGKGQHNSLPAWVEVTDEFSAYLDDSMPLRLETVQAIGGNCLAFDLYTWLNLRHYSITWPYLVKWEELHEQLGTNYKDLRCFKAKLKKSWQIISTHYRHNSKIVENGVQLIRSKTDVEIKNYSQAKALDFLQQLGVVENL